MRLPGRLWIAALALGVALGVAGSAVAQGHGGGGGGMGHGGGGMGPGGMGPRDDSPPFGNRGPGGNRPMDTGSAGSLGNQGSSGQARPGLELGPPGRWWDDKSVVKSLKLRPDQQTRMDAIFEQNRPALLTKYQSLQQAESQMAEVSKVPNPDEAALFAGIDKVAQARAELDKANTHMLLQLRKQMDPDQIERLEKKK